MNYERFDLNLLNVFDAVMIELNVTRAAVQLNMTQPAVSNALKRLRHLLEDELFVKVPSGVSPTPKALEIWQPVREALNQIRQTLEPIEFNPSTETANITIALNDFSAMLLLPPLMGHLETLSPKLNLRTIPNTHINAAMLLEQSEIDIAIGVFPSLLARLRSQTLLTSSWVCAMRGEHPLARKKLTLNRYVQAKHLLVTLTGEATGVIDPVLQERGLSRRIGLTVNQFSVVPQILVNSDLIAVLPARVIQLSAIADQLHVTEVPIEITPTSIKMMWHERSHQNAAQSWFREQVAEVCSNL
ncbi:LysR family transcriptional regulator [Vacuolonema iberomarrocanum]|uniref:LysR family transcriptional regulator n=1 Tax=Vacuolonema iberomarrocanum TaxID=3454632 RepID=UPI0019E1BD6B|nr:LysR family transcriptional regulator [filamentous cyanobacterium LEGE 07170]